MEILKIHVDAKPVPPQMLGIWDIEARWLTEMRLATFSFITATTCRK